MQVLPAHSGAAQVQLTPAAQSTGRVWHENVGVQASRQPGCPVAGQLAVAVAPAGQVPLAGTGVHCCVPQLCWLTQSSLAPQTTSPQSGGASGALSVPPSELPPPELQPASAPATASRTITAPLASPVRMRAMLTPTRANSVAR